MAVVPKKLRFQLRFRSKTKTRKILNRDLRLQGLLKKDSSDSNRSCILVVKKEQQLLLKNSLTPAFLGIKTQRTENINITKAVGTVFKNNNYLYSKLSDNTGLETRFVVQKKAPFCSFSPFVKKTGVNSGLVTLGDRSHNSLVKPNKYLYVYKKKSFFRPSWFLTNRITINTSNYINPKKFEGSTLLTYGRETNCNSFRPEKFLSTDRIPSKSKLLNSVLKPDSVFLKKKAVVVPQVNRLLFGRYGVCFKGYSIISAKCAETAKLDIAKTLRKKGRSWIRICCDTPVSARPAETRMGKGKGSISYWAAKVSPGQLFFEFSGINREQLKDIYQKLCKKSPVSLKIIC